MARLTTRQPGPDCPVDSTHRRAGVWRNRQLYVPAEAGGVAPVRIFAADPRTIERWIYNNTNVAIAIGNSGVGFSAGDQDPGSILPPNSLTIMDTYYGDLYAIANGAAADLRLVWLLDEDAGI